MSVTLKRVGNVWGSYEYTLRGIRYEIVNPNKEDRFAPVEWRVQEWDNPQEVIFYGLTLKEVRDFLTGEENASIN